MLCMLLGGFGLFRIRDFRSAGFSAAFMWFAGNLAIFWAVVEASVRGGGGGVLGGARCRECRKPAHHDREIAPISPSP